MHPPIKWLANIPLYKPVEPATIRTKPFGFCRNCPALEASRRVWGQPGAVQVADKAAVANAEGRHTPALN